MGQLQQLQYLYKTTLFPYFHIILQVLIFLLKHRNTGIFKKVISIQHSWKRCSVPKEMGKTSGKNEKTIHLHLLAVQCHVLGKTKTNLARPTASLRSS